MTGFPQTAGVRANLRLVETHAGSARPPRRLDVNMRLNVLTGREPYARSREFKLSYDDFEKLIAVAEKLESRR